MFNAELIYTFIDTTNEATLRLVIQLPMAPHPSIALWLAGDVYMKPNNVSYQVDSNTFICTTTTKYHQRSVDKMLANGWLILDQS